jgi:hypothetical protein
MTHRRATNPHRQKACRLWIGGLDKRLVDFHGRHVEQRAKLIHEGIAVLGLSVRYFQSISTSDFTVASGIVSIATSTSVLPCWRAASSTSGAW